METTTCTCTPFVGDLNAEHHDRLLSMESRGAAGFAELLNLVTSQIELSYEEGDLHWFELSVFVSLHNWQDPVNMVRIASAAEDFGRALTRNMDLESAMENFAQRAQELNNRLNETPTDRIERWLREQGDESQ